MQSGDQPELSRSELAALDLVIADMEENGKTTLDPEEAFTLTTILRFVTATTPVLTAAVGEGKIPEAEAIKALASEGVTLESLITAREQIRQR
jgi:hypothetical protein